MASDPLTAWLDATLRLAEEATPGPWSASRDTRISVYVEPPKGYAVCNLIVPFEHALSGRRTQAHKDADLIAAIASPPVAKALLGVVRAADEQRLMWIRPHCEDWHDQMDAMILSLQAALNTLRAAIKEHHADHR